MYIPTSQQVLFQVGRWLVQLIRASIWFVKPLKTTNYDAVGVAADPGGYLNITLFIHEPNHSHLWPSIGDRCPSHTLATQVFQPRRQALAQLWRAWRALICKMGGQDSKGNCNASEYHLRPGKSNRKRKHGDCQSVKLMTTA